MAAATKVHTDLADHQVHRWLLIIVAVAVLLRVAAALYMGDQVQDLPGIFDQITYDRLAQNVVAGNGFSFDVDWWPATRAGEPTAHWSYLTTLYLAGFYLLFGHHPLVPRMVQAILCGIVMPLLTYRLAARLSNRTVGLTAAGICAVYIYFFYYAAALMTEAFFFLAILGVLNVALDLADHPTWQRWAALGLVSGCAVLLRQAFLIVVPLVLFWILWARRGQIRLLHMLIPLFILALMILPWTIRNYLAFHQFVLLNTNSGYVFFWANHPIHGTSFVSILGPEYPSYRELIPPELVTLDEAALDKALLREGLGFVLEDPIRYVLLSLSRLKDYFLFWPRPESSLLSNISRVGSFGIFLPFMLYGLVLSLRSLPRPLRGQPPAGRRAAFILLYLFVLLYSSLHLLTWAYVRYRLPVDTVLVVFAALGLYDLYQRVAKHRTSTREND